MTRTRVSLRHHRSTLLTVIGLLADKTKGSMTTMPGFFEANPGLHKEYKSLSDEAKTGVLKQHLQAKAEENKVNLTKYRSNSAISRAVDARVTIITTMVSFLWLPS
jgi:hypothetical protein